jgi:hypothetical protein
MASGDGTDRLNHRKQRKSKSESNSQISDLASGQHRATNSSENEHKCADKLASLLRPRKEPPPMLQATSFWTRRNCQK